MLAPHLGEILDLQLMCYFKVDDSSYEGCYMYYVKQSRSVGLEHLYILLSSGGSRIFLRGGGLPTPRVSVLTYFLQSFYRKLHENERIWTPRGGTHS